MSRFININMNVGNARMTYIVKRREYVATISKKKMLQPISHRYHVQVR